MAPFCQAFGLPHCRLRLLGQREPRDLTDLVGTKGGSIGRGHVAGTKVALSGSGCGVACMFTKLWGEWKEFFIFLWEIFHEFQVPLGISAAKTALEMFDTNVTPQSWCLPVVSWHFDLKTSLSIDTIV